MGSPSLENVAELHDKFRALDFEIAARSPCAESEANYTIHKSIDATSAPMDIELLNRITRHRECGTYPSAPPMKI